MKDNKDDQLRYLINIYGIVQGVGFRPFIFNLALEFGLKGYVNNKGASVQIDAEGYAVQLKSFVKRIMEAPPPLSQIERITVRRAELKDYKDFTITHSNSEDKGLRFISADTAVCSKCMDDISNPDSRWFGYAFTNCTDCGPRYSIIEALPYDRCNTSMGGFEMCPDCRAEYENPTSRRFHAQPVCCPECGPQLQLMSREGRVLEAENAIKMAAALLREGNILAVKGIGGFHLMCGAENSNAVMLLRARKRRPHKPLAVMMANVEVIEQHCSLNETEKQLLQSPSSPIVLLKKKLECSLPEILAPDTDSLGVMLPYAPLHTLLFGEGLKCLVSTSGNISGMPIEYENAGAVHSLSEIADYYLLHDRDILMPVDDSVVKVVKDEKVLSRLGRGYAPLAIHTGSRHQLVALGAEQKASISIACSGYVYTSQYLGDLKGLEAYKGYKKVLDKLLGLLDVKPDAYVHDLHPYYISTQYALSQPMEKIGIQHHFAHMAGCIRENKLRMPSIGVIFDGTGLGDDGNIWGGEILVQEASGYIRAGHLSNCMIQGGDKSIEEPWRSAMSYLHSLGYNAMEWLPEVRDQDKEMVIAALKAGVNCYKSSSMGRLFDCIAALLGLCSVITYDAQGAIRLEQAADKHISACYEQSISWKGDQLLLDYMPIITGVAKDMRQGIRSSEIAAKFHNTIAAVSGEAVGQLSKLYGIKNVVLSGGCFENQLLLRLVINQLDQRGLNVYINKLLPCNDGGISFGQLAAAEMLLRG